MKKKTVALLLCLILAITLLSGCGSGGSSGEPVDPGESSDATDEYNGLTEEAFNELTAIIAGYSEKPKFEAPGEAFDLMAALQGKKILEVPMSSANPFTIGIANCTHSICDAIGIEHVIWENQGEVNEWIQGLEMAGSLDANIVNLSGGTNPLQMAAQIEETIAKNIDVVSSHYSCVTQTVDYVQANCGAPYAEAGALLGDWACLYGGGDVNCVIVTSDEVPSCEAMVNAMETEFNKYAPNSKRKYVNVPCNEWADKIQTEVTTALQSDPDVDYIIAIYDSQTDFIIPAVELAGKTGQVKIIGFNGTPQVIDNVRNGLVEMTIGENLFADACAAIDTIGRLEAGLEIPVDTKIPLYIWTSENAEEAGVPAEYSKGYGEAWQKGYAELWGLDSSALDNVK